MASAAGRCSPARSSPACPTRARSRERSRPSRAGTANDARIRHVTDTSLFQTLLSRVDDAGGYGVKLSAHMMTLYALARRASGPVVECGVGSGFSTLALLAGTAEAGVTLTSYDINARARDAALQTIGCGPDDVRIGHWTCHALASQDAASEWAPATVGLLFLDTTH